MNMSRLNRSLTAAVLALSVLCVVVPKLAIAAGSNNSKGPKEESYIVIQEGEDYKAITASSYNDEVKRLKDDYKQKMDLWQDDRKSDPTIPQPKKIIPKKVMTGFKTQQGAKDYIDKLLDKEGKNDRK
jgi:hypothetical protein